MTNRQPPGPDSTSPDPAEHDDARAEAFVKVDDPGGSHPVGYAADAKPPEPPKDIPPYPLAPPDEKPGTSEDKP